MARWSIDKRTELPWLGWTFINHSFCFCHHHHWWWVHCCCRRFAVSMYVCCWMLPTLISLHADWCGVVGFYSTCFSEAFYVAWSPQYMHVEYHLFTFHYSRKKKTTTTTDAHTFSSTTTTSWSNNKEQQKQILWQVTPWRKRASKRNAHRQCLSNMCVRSFGHSVEQWIVNETWKKKKTTNKSHQNCTRIMYT